VLVLVRCVLSWDLASTYKGVVCLTRHSFTCNRDNTTHYWVCFYGAAIAWGSWIQSAVATSTCEAEYMAAGAALRKFFIENLGYSAGAMEIKGDNQATPKLLENPFNQTRS
jgi:hypothetical protein